MIPKAWARALSFAIVISLLTSVYVITDFPTMDVKAVNHGGIISANETWSGTGNHFITSNVTIPENITVYVEAGASILFEVIASLGPLNIFVNGTFILDGTAADMITVYPRVQSGKEFPGDWGTIYYNATSNDTASKVSHTEIAYGTTGLYLEDSNILVENSLVHNSSQEGILVYASSPIIRNCTLKYNNFGIWAEAGGNPLIMNNTIEWNMYDGIYAVSRVNPTIKNNIIRNNIDDGVHILAFNEGEISGNIVTYNRDMGMVLNVRADMLVKDNNISRNGDAGIWMRAAGPTIHHNLITNNTRNGVRIFDCKVNEGCPAPTIVNNTIAYNNKESGLYPGIFVENADPLIMNNYIAFNDAEGIYLRRDSGGNISSNAILNNQLGISVNESYTWIVNNNPISGNIAGIYVRGGDPLIRENVITNNKYGIYTFDGAKPGIYKNVISSASGKDLIVGDKEGKVTYFQNRGESVFKDLGRIKLDTGEDIYVESFAAPGWGDIDNDGLEDLVIGNGRGNVHYFRNLGDGYFHDMGALTNETPVTYLRNINGKYCNPFVTDWDQDGDMDLFCGTTLSGHIYYFTNNGDNVFTGQGRVTEGPINPLNPGSKSAPFFFDWNGDNDDDLIVGNFWGDVRYYENNGGIGNISFTYSNFLQWTDGMNAYNIAAQGNNIVPWLVDWSTDDGDPRMDLVTSNETGVFLWERAIANLFNPPKQLLSSVTEINARAVDWNADGYNDLIVGGMGGYVKYYRNDGTDNFVLMQMKNGSVGGQDLYVLPWASPFPVDFDGDNILDLLVGTASGDVYYYKGTAVGSPIMQFVQILRGSGMRQDIKVGGLGFGMANVFSLDWDKDDWDDLVVGEVNRAVWLFTNDGDGTFSSHGMAHNETGEPIRTFGLASAPAVGDWDGDMLEDLIVGDMNGYLEYWRRNSVPGDYFNFTKSGYLYADGVPLKVSQYACPYVDDWNADGDLDVLVGEESGRILYYENNGDGTLTFKRNLTNVLGGDVKVSNNACPQGVGYHGSLQGYKGGIGIYAKDSAPEILNNIMIKGGDGNRTAGVGEAGGIGIYLLRADAVIMNNKNISGGTGGLGLSVPTDDVVGGLGGHGIFLDESTGFISDNTIIGGLGGPAEAAASPYLSIGGEGGSGVFSVNNTTTTILNNIIIAGDGSFGINKTGGNGSGVKATNNSQPYVENCKIVGGIGVYASNSTPFIVNSTIESYVTSFNASDGAHAVALNTTFDRTKTYYGDDESVLETQWFLHVKVVDRSGFPVPEATITIERDGLSFKGHLSSAFAPLATTAGPAPAVVDWDEDGDDDLIVGENDGDVQWYKNQGDNTYQTPPVTLLDGRVTGMYAARPCVYDLDFDGEPDVVIGDSLGNVYWYKRNGINLEFYSYFHIVDGGQYLGDVNVSGKAAPAIGDWNLDGYWDLVIGDQTGFVNIFTRHPGTFLNFSIAGIARMTDGTPARSVIDAIPHVVDWNDDGKRDLIIASVGQVRLYLSCENGTLLWGGPFYSNRSGLNPILVGGFSSVTVLDYNGDGDLDLLVGATNVSLPDTGNIEYFESNRNGNTRTLQTDWNGELRWIVVTEFIESDKNGNHFGNNEGDKVYYTPHSIKATKNVDIGCASPLALMTESREVIVTMCRDVTLPTIVDTYPVPGQQGVPINTIVKIWFSKPMNPSKTFVTVYNDGPTPGTPFTATWEDNNKTLNLCLNNFPCLMEYDRHYTVKISGASQDQLGLYLDGNKNGVQNGAGVDDYVFSFHTEVIDNTPPVAVLNHWPPVASFVAPADIIFSGANSTDNKGIVWWDLTVENDAGPPLQYSGFDIVNATTPSISYIAPGTYCAFLNVTDGASNEDNAVDCVTIIGVDTEPPNADAGPDQTIAPGQTIFFDGSGSSDNVTPQWDLNYKWIFFNGTGGDNLSGMNPTYSGFRTVGSWVVTLNVTDEAGLFDTDTMVVTVEFDPRPRANAGPSFDICTGGIVTLDGSGTTDNNPIGDLVFNWTFNDGTGPVFLQGMIVAHQFNVSGNFLITLNVTDASGGSDVDTTWVNATTCYKPAVDDWAPRGPDHLPGVDVWARFSKDMQEPNLTFSFTLKEDLSGAQVLGNASYDQVTRTFTFDPFVDLDSGVTYRACFNASVAVDTEGFYLDGNKNNVSEMHPTDTFCWTFRTANLPSVMSTSPFPGQTDVHVKDSIYVAFNEPMDTGSVIAAFSMTDGTSTWDAGSFNVSWDAQALVFTFSDFAFEFSKTYEVTIDASLAMSEKGILLDGNKDGYPMGSPTDDYKWSFSTEATPKVTAGVPTGIDVALDASIVLTFNKIMDWASVKSALTIKEDGIVVGIDTFGVTSFDNMAHTFTIDPFSLENGVPYNITLSGNAISGAKDLNGNTLDGNRNSLLEGSPADDYSWEFLTVAIDDVPPQVVSNYPSDGTTGVPLDEQITITFNEQMMETSFATGIIARVNITAYSLEPFADYVWDTGSRTLTLTPNGGLDYDTTYSIIVSGSYYDGVMDLANNPLDGDKDGIPDGSPEDDHIFVFKTPDPIPPYIVNTTPYADEADVRQDTNITIKFDDAMNETTLNQNNTDIRDELGTPVSGQLTYNAQTRTLTFDPDGPLRPGMTYTVTISDVADTDGNSIAAPYSWSFTTKLDYTPPVVNILSPAHGFETTVGDELTIYGTAFDDSGIQSVSIQFGGGSQIDITPNYDPVNGTWSYTLDTSDYGPGELTINVTAYDLLLLWGSDEISINIKDKPAEDMTWLIMVILAIIIAVVATLLFFFVWRRRKGTMEDEIIAEEVAEEMAEERETAEEPIDEAEVREDEEVVEIGEVEEVEEGDIAKGPPPKLKKPVRRVKK